MSYVLIHCRLFTHLHGLAMWKFTQPWNHFVCCSKNIVSLIIVRNIASNTIHNKNIFQYMLDPFITHVFRSSNVGHFTLGFSHTRTACMRFHCLQSSVVQSQAFMYISLRDDHVRWDVHQIVSSSSNNKIWCNLTMSWQLKLKWANHSSMSLIYL